MIAGTVVSWCTVQKTSALYKTVMYAVAVQQCIHINNRLAATQSHFATDR